MDLFELALAKKLAGGGGGGGGDFDIATVGITNNSGDRVGLTGSLVGSQGGMSFIAPTANVATGDTQWSVAIYKDGAIIQFNASANYSVTGSIMQIDVASFLVSGNGTITIS